MDPSSTSVKHTNPNPFRVPDEGSGLSRGGSWTGLALVLFVGVVLFGGNLGERALFGTSEPRYAGVAKTMMEQGEFLIPHWRGGIYSEKPPLHFWTVILCSLPGGRVTEVTARLPSVLAGLGLLLLAWVLGCRYFGDGGGILAGLFLATAAGLQNYARQCKLDGPLAFWVALSISFWIRSREDDRPSDALWAGVAMGFATLTKGPVGIVLPTLVVLGTALYRDEPGRFRRLRPGYVFPTAVAVVLLWLVPACIVGGEGYAGTILWRQTVVRYFDPWMHVKSVWDEVYLAKLPEKMLPWPIFLPGLIVWAVCRPAAPSSPGQRGFRLGMWWILGMLIFFQLSPGKRENYLIPFLPGAALLLAGFWVEMWPLRKTRRGRLSLGMPLAFLFLLLPAFLWAAPSLKHIRYASLEAQAMLPVFLTVAGGLCLAGIVFLARERYAAALATAIFLCVGGSVLIHQVYEPPFKNSYSDRELCLELNRRLEPETRWGLFHMYTASLFFYTDRAPQEFSHRDLDKLEEFCRSRERVYCVMRLPDYVRVLEAWDFGLYIIRVAPFELDQRLLLVSNQPDST